MEPLVAIHQENNPWAVDSLMRFSYFCCPECDRRCQAKQEFINHAFENHPVGAFALYAIKDISIAGVEFPLHKEEPKFEEDNAETKPGFDTRDLTSDASKGDIDELNVFEEDRDSDFEDIKGDFKCLVCRKIFDTAVKLSSHACTKTIGEGKLDRKMKSISKLKTGDDGFVCEHCDYKGKNEVYLMAHIKKRHNKENGLTCDGCNEKFNSNHMLRMHMLKEHRVGKDVERCLCSLCGKTLVGKSNFKKHEREKHGIDNINRKRIVKPLKLECSKCFNCFNSISILNEHSIDCFGESKEFPCIHCDLKLASGSVLNLHLKADHGVGEMYTCHVCGKCFKRKISVDSHIKVEHENVKDHVCHLCGTGFARAQGLKFHIQRVHEHSGRYACEYCEFKTVAQMKLDIHVNEVHTKAIKYPCRECNFFCYRKGGLLAHVKTVHLKLKPHECSVCSEAFVRRKELEKHKSTTGH